MTKQFKSIKLGEIFNPMELQIVYDFIKTKDWKGLREFLHSIDDILEKKGFLTDYLYYQLEFLFREKDFIIDKDIEKKQ